MTLQEIGDKIVNHLKTQKVRSKGMHGSSHSREEICLYRDGNGNSCAVGCLIDDEHYNETMESCLAVDNTIIDAVCASIGGFGDKLLLSTFLSDMQSVHDSHMVDGYNEETKSKAKEVFERFKLEFK